LARLRLIAFAQLESAASKTGLFAVEQSTERTKQISTFGRRVFATSTNGSAEKTITTMITETPKKTKGRERAMPARNAYAFTIKDAQRMGAPGKSTIYEFVKAGRLTFLKREPGLPVMLTGDSVRALLGINLED
jgi:hypothetical protein